MTSYQDLFINMDNNTIDPSTLSQQDALASLFPGIPSLNPAMIDNWLAEELCKTGLIANSLEFIAGSEKQQQDILALLPHSPPISPNSPTDSAISASSSQKSPKTPCTATMSLFPEIAPHMEKPAPVVHIMPKTATMILPRIAPRPTATPTVIMKEPIAPIVSNKRRLMESNVVVDQDEIAMKRQKNTDAARRSRLKKLVKMEQLEQKVSDLESDNHRLTTRIAVLESEKSGLESKDNSLEDRIRVLEAQLAEAHKALTKA
ncbi:unnamed protein product [Mucor hiemalis]